MEDWALVRRLAADGLPKKKIAERLGISRTTVIRAVASDVPPKYVRKPVVSAFAVFEPRVRALLKDEPELPAVVLAERVGWTGSESWFRACVAKLRDEYRRIDPADRIDWAPGDVIQCDLWFPPYKVPLEDGTSVLLPVLVMTCAFSRFMMGLMVPSRKTADLLLGMWHLLTGLGRVPRRLIWDNEAGIGRGKRHAQGVDSFIGTLACRLHLLRARDPESKGAVERRNRWFETSFMPGRVFASPADFNAQFADWLAKANNRVVRTTGARPVDRLDADLAAMLALPPIPPACGWASQTRLGRDYYVRIAGNDYSVDPSAIWSMVDVTADLEHVQVRCGGRLVAEHPRVWATGRTVTDPAHVATAQVLREAFQQPRLMLVDDLNRDLGDYDKAFGIDWQEVA